MDIGVLRYYMHRPARILLVQADSEDQPAMRRIKILGRA